MIEDNQYNIKQYTHYKRKRSSDDEDTIIAENNVFNTKKKEDKKKPDDNFSETIKNLEKRMNMKIEELETMIKHQKVKEEDNYIKSNVISSLNSKILNLEKKNKNLHDELIIKKEKYDIIIMDLNDKINILMREKSKDKKDIYNLNKKCEAYKGDIYNINKKCEVYKGDIHNLNKERDKNRFEIKALNYDLIRLNKIIDELSLKREEDRKVINELLSENKNLKNEVTNLSSFVFSAKLRKLLKKLLEFIMRNYYNLYMKYEDKKLSFISVPKKISIENKEDILKALNKILEIIFKNAKIYDYTLHFVDKDVLKSNKIKSNIVVFSTCRDFFKFFDIEKYEKILLNYIPKEYFTIINNSSFESKIPDLLSKWCK